MSSQGAPSPRRSGEGTAEAASGSALDGAGSGTPARAVGASSPRPSASQRPASFAAVSASLVSFFSGHGKQSTAEPRDTVPRSAPAVAFQTAVGDVDAFPTLPPAAVLAELFPDAETRAAVTDFWHERALEWSIDPRTLGGERTASNRGAAALMRLVSSATLTSHAEGAGARSSMTSSRDVAGEQSDSEPDQTPAAAEDRSQDHAAAGQRKFQRNYETHDVLRAIEQKDTELLMHIRDVNFDLLLDLQGGASSGIGGGSGGAGVSTPLG